MSAEVHHRMKHRLAADRFDADHAQEADPAFRTLIFAA